MNHTRPRIALWFRYGPAEHTELFHAIPEIVERLAARCEVHYYGLRSEKPLPPRILEHAVVHHLPFTVNRKSERDKLFKTALWLLSIPWIGLTCRIRGVRAVYIDETVPLTAPLARLFFGPKVALTVADFFVDIYLAKPGLGAWLGWIIRTLDFAAWRKLPLIFTRAQTTRQYLASKGVDPSRVHPVYDPCDLSIYRPVSPETRKAARQRLGYGPDEVVLVHHGILHPNKGNDRILRALAEARAQRPNLRYLLIGDGPEMAHLRSLAGELKIDDIVQFTGWLDRLEEVNEALNAGDVGLVMRTGQESDNFHMTGALVHSMACGLPVLAAKLGGICEILRDGENAFLFDPNDMAEFQEKLIRLADSVELRQRFAALTLAAARQHFDMTRVAELTAEPLIALANGATR